MFISFSLFFERHQLLSYFWGLSLFFEEGWSRLWGPFGGYCCFVRERCQVSQLGDLLFEHLGGPISVGNRRYSWLFFWMFKRMYFLLTGDFEQEYRCSRACTRDLRCSRLGLLTVSALGSWEILGNYYLLSWQYSGLISPIIQLILSLIFGQIAQFISCWRLLLLRNILGESFSYPQPELGIIMPGPFAFGSLKTHLEQLQ